MTPTFSVGCTQAPSSANSRLSMGMIALLAGQIGVYCSLVDGRAVAVVVPSRRAG